MRSACSSLVVRGLGSLIIIVGLTSLIGCAGGGSPEADSRVVPASHDPNSCRQFKPTDGPTALMGNAGQRRIVQSEYFNKPYNAPDLEAVLQANINSTSDYVKSIGVNLYRIQHQTTGAYCQNFYALTEAPAPYRQRWERANPSEGTLAGLYFDDCGSGCSSTRVIKPVVLIDDSMDRWTLIHEMMHFNFDQSRKLSSEVDYGVLMRRISSLLNVDIPRYRAAYEALPNERDLRQAAQAFDEIAHLLEQASVQYPLEEMAIEAQLIDAKHDGRLQFVTDDAASSAAWYLGQTKALTTRRFDLLIAEMAWIDPETTRFQWPEVSAQTAATRAFVDALKHRLDEIQSRACDRAGRDCSNNRRVTPAMASIITAHLELTNPHLAAIDRAPPLVAFDRGIAALHEATR